MKTRKCLHCKKPLLTNKPNQMYCSGAISPECQRARKRKNAKAKKALKNQKIKNIDSRVEIVENVTLDKTLIELKSLVQENKEKADLATKKYKTLLAKYKAQKLELTVLKASLSYEREVGNL